MVSARRCGFAEALAALHELIGVKVQVSVGPVRAPGTFLTSVATLARGYELGRSERSSIAFDVGETTLRFSPQSFVTAWREEYARRTGATRRLVVAIELRSGVEVEIEELGQSGSTG